MTRFWWVCRCIGWCLFLVLLCFATAARAEDAGKLRGPIHVCVRPGNVPSDVDRWAITLGGTVLIGPLAEVDDKKSGIIRYVFDPSAPPESTKLLPIPHNKLTCAARVLPLAIPVLPSETAPPAKEPEKTKKKEAPKAAEKQPAPPEKGDAPETAPLPLPKPIAKPLPQEPPVRLPANGVTTRWSSTVLPVKDKSRPSSSGRVLLAQTVPPIASKSQAPGNGTAAPAPRVSPPQPPSPGGRTYDESKAILDAKSAVEEADRAGYAFGVKFGKAVGGVQEGMKSTSLFMGKQRFEWGLKRDPKWIDQIQADLTAKLNAIPDFPTYSDPKLAEAARKGFERGYPAGLVDAKVKAGIVDAAALAALALTPAGAAVVEQTAAKALRAALTRFRAMPVFVPSTAGGPGGFLRLPKPKVAGGAGASAGESAAAAPAAAEAGASAKAPPAAPAAKGGANPTTRAAASKGSTLHSDKPGNLPEQLRARYPDTKFEFTKPGVPGQDVKVVGGKHPSEYSGSTWPKGVNRGDFKPGTPSGARTFSKDQAKKWPDPTVMIPYEPNSGKLK
jgi:hypothetical protein